MNSEGQDAAAVRIPPPLVFSGAVLAGALLQRFALAFPLPLEVGPRLGITVLCTALGLWTMGAALGLFNQTGQDPKPWKTTPEIISTGIYRWSRNPMYVGMALLQTALGVGLANGWIVALLPVVLLTVFVTAIRHEEAYLERKFGGAYLNYKLSVRRWL